MRKLSGKHYSMCWYVHTIINEALKRLFVRHYLQGSEQFISNLQCLKGTDGMKENIFNNVITLLTEKYQQLKKKGLEGELGKTAQYWLIYMEMVSKFQSVLICNKHQQFGTADWCVRIFSSVIFCNQENTLYSVWNVLYSTIKEFDSTYPRAFEEICEMVSVRRNKTGIGQVTDLAGEPTYMRNAKKELFY